MTFLKNDDVSWANKIVFLLAKALSCAFHPESNADAAALQQISEEIEDWERNKPASFQPIFFESPSREESRAFPQIWMLLPFHGEYMTPSIHKQTIVIVMEVVGMQYYHIAKVVIAISAPRAAISGYESLREGRKLEVTSPKSHTQGAVGLSSLR
jgi:hypothetical protein